VFSVGDVFVAAGVGAVVALAMRMLPAAPRGDVSPHLVVPEYTGEK
jgi:hypothetical protein